MCLQCSKFNFICDYSHVALLNYIICSVMHAFWLVLTYDLLEDRCIDDVIIKTFFNSLLYKTNRFQVAVCLFSNRSQRMSKCGKNISDTLGCTSCATFLFLQHFDVLCDLSLNRRTATWNLFVKQTSLLPGNYPSPAHTRRSLFWRLGRRDIQGTKLLCVCNAPRSIS